MQTSNEQQKRFVKWPVTIAVIALIIGVAGFAYYFAVNKRARTVKPANSNISAAADRSMLQQREFDNRVGEMATQGDIDGVNKAYAQKIDAVTSSTEKAGLLLQKSVTFSDHGEYTEGLNAALQSEKLYGSSDSVKDALGQVVTCYVNLKDYRSAKTYVEKLLAAIRSGQSDYKYNESTYTAELKWLNSVLGQS